MRTILVFIFMLSQLQAMAQRNGHNIKTDGVYIFDNNIRTYTPAVGGIIDSLRNLFRNHRKDPIYEIYPQTCIPKGAVGAGISDNSLLIVMMFSKTGKTLEYITACRDKQTWEDIKKIHRQFQENATNPIAEQFGVESIKYLDNETFVIKGESITMPEGSYQSSSYYKIFKDSIVQKVNIPLEAFRNADGNFRLLISEPKTYHFFSFDKVPESFKGGIKILKEKSF